MAREHFNRNYLYNMTTLHGLTETQLSIELNISQPTVSRWLRGEVNPSAENLVKLSERFNLPLERFWVEHDRNESESRLRDMLYDLQVSGKKRDIKYAIDAHEKLYGRIEIERDEAIAAVIDWRHPDLFAFESERCLEVANYTGDIPLIVSGPTRTGKTLKLIEKAVGLHFANRGFRSLWLRSDAVDLTETLRRDLRDVALKYHLDDPLSPIRADGLGGSQNFKSLEINGGEMVFGGMNRPERVLGTSFNLIFCSQIEQFTEEQFNFLLTRCAGDAPNWTDENGRRLGLLIADANPDTDDHWLKEYEADGKVKFVNFDFDDNPLFCRKGKRTEPGIDVIGRLDRSLTGIYHDRFFKGLWLKVIGKIFDTDDKVHYIDEPDDLSVYNWFRACDFGIDAPSVCLWIGEHRVNGDVYVHREFRKSKTDTIALGNEINTHTQERVLGTVIDNDEDKQILLRKHCQIPTDMTEKSPNTIEDSIHLIQNGLRNAADGIDGGLYINRGLRCNADPRLIKDKKPLSLIDEFKTYATDPKTDKPIKENDHAIAALRYIYLWFEKRKAALGFGSGSAKRGKRL